MVEMEVEDNTDPGTYKASLKVREKDTHPEHLLNTSLFYNWNANGSQTPMKRDETMPKRGWGSQYPYSSKPDGDSVPLLHDAV